MINSRARLDEVSIKNKQLEAAVKQLAAMAATDPLTGLANRGGTLAHHGSDRLPGVRYGHDLACIMIDLDGFKLLNGTRWATSAATGILEARRHHGLKKQLA